MIWLAFGLGVAGVIGAVAVVVMAMTLRRRFSDFGHEAEVLSQRVSELARAVEGLQTRSRD